MSKKELEPKQKIMFCYIDEHLPFDFGDLEIKLGKKYSLKEIKAKLGSSNFGKALSRLQSGDQCLFFLRIKNLEQLAEFFPHWQKASSRGVSFKLLLLDQTLSANETNPPDLRASNQFKKILLDSNTELFKLLPKASKGFTLEKVIKNQT